MNDHGNHKDGTPITDTDVEAMADEAERGYDVDTPLDPELKRALLIRAGQEHISVSEVIRWVIGEYLRAS